MIFRKLLGHLSGQIFGLGGGPTSDVNNCWLNLVVHIFHGLLNGLVSVNSNELSLLLKERKQLFRRLIKGLDLLRQDG